MKRSFHQHKTPAEVAEYVRSLNQRWPIRPQIMVHIAAQVKALPVAAPHVLELCCGTGLLAETLLDALPTARYTGIDFSQPFLDAARARLDRFADRATLIQADLNRAAWLNLLKAHGADGCFHAIVSMQSLHDLGGEPQVNRIYRLARDRLLPDGLFLNADLIVQPGEELPDNPGRRSIARHMELLESHGYCNVACTLERGGFGCVVGFAPSMD